MGFNGLTRILQQIRNGAIAEAAVKSLDSTRFLNWSQEQTNKAYSSSDMTESADGWVLAYHVWRGTAAQASYWYVVQ